MNMELKNSGKELKASPSNKAENSKRRYFFILFILMACAITGCTSVKDISKERPYSEAIGKSFVLQQDMYIFQYNGDPGLNLGRLINKDHVVNGIPIEVNEKYIGLKCLQLTIKGVIKKGDVIILSSVKEERSFNDIFYGYYVIIKTQPHFANKELRVSSMLNVLKNPPYTQTWSDPPIFKAEYALPLPSDGVWWKQQN
jgi:hypothetical protein